MAGFEGVPSFTGDDLALVYAQPAANATGASLLPPAARRQPPESRGRARELARRTVYFGGIYRRGAFAGPPPDVDLDGIGDALDNCRYEANPAQTNATPNGIGDACECGDLGTNGQVEDADVTALRSWLARAAGPIPALQRCSVRGGSSATWSTTRCSAARACRWRRASRRVCAAASPL